MEKACKRIGLKVDSKSGKGSHIKVTYPGKGATIIPHHINSGINHSLCKTLHDWGFNDEDIRKALKIKH